MIDVPQWGRIVMWALLALQLCFSGVSAVRSVKAAVRRKEPQPQFIGRILLEIGDYLKSWIIAAGLLVWIYLAQDRILWPFILGSAAIFIIRDIGLWVLRVHEEPPCISPAPSNGWNGI